MAQPITALLQESDASPSLVARISLNTIHFSMPFYRQVMFAEHG